MAPERGIAHSVSSSRRPVSAAVPLRIGSYVNLRPGCSAEDLFADFPLILVAYSIIKQLAYVPLWSTFWIWFHVMTNQIDFRDALSTEIPGPAPVSRASVQGRAGPGTPDVQGDKSARDGRKIVRDLMMQAPMSTVRSRWKRNRLRFQDLSVPGEKRNSMDDAGCGDDLIGRIRMEIQLCAGQSDFERDRNDTDLPQESSEFQTVEIHRESPELNQLGQFPEDNW